VIYYSDRRSIDEHQVRGADPEAGTDDMKPQSPNPTRSTNPGLAKGWRLVLIALLCAGVVFGCAQFRKATYPSDYVYLDRKQLRSKMALLSFYMDQLDEVMQDDAIVGSDQQQRILDLLNDIKGVTAGLGGGITTNHLVIDDHIDQFKIDVATAIRGARSDPPNYFAVGRLSGSCVACHQYRD